MYQSNYVLVRFNQDISEDILPALVVFIARMNFLKSAIEST